MSKLGIFLWYFFILEVWKDGDGHSYILNKWNPLSWIIFVLSVLLIFLFHGFDGVVEEWEFNQIGLGYTKYWKDNKVVFVRRRDGNFNA